MECLPHWRQALATGAVTLSLGYAAMAALLFLTQARVVYCPDRRVLATPAAIGLAYESLRLKTEDGIDLSAWFVPAAAETAGTLLFCHGNGGNMGDRLDSVAVFHGLGLNVLIFDYRGYGDSAGRPTEAGTYADALAAWRFLERDRGIEPARIVVFGRSLGGAVAAWLARRETPGALILESAFTSAPDVAAGLYWYLPARWLCRFAYDTRSYLRGGRCPVLVAHSRDDDMIPFAHGRALYEAAPEPKSFLEMTGGHNDLDFVLGGKYARALGAFLAEHGFQAAGGAAGGREGTRTPRPEGTRS